MDELTVDDVLRILYAEASHVEAGKVAEVEFEHSMNDGDDYFRVCIRNEVTQEKPFNSNTYYGKDAGEE